MANGEEEKNGRGKAKAATDKSAEDKIAREAGAKDKEKNAIEAGAKETILAAIRQAADELGRAPSRGELRRITGLSHYKVLAVFPTLREAVRAAGLEPNPKGEKISTEDLLADWKRVAEKLGRRPSRAEYVREGKYSAGALTVRFGSWGGISTAEDAEEHGEKKAIHRGGAETRRTAKGSDDLVIGRSGDHPNTRNPRALGTPGDRKTRSAAALTKAGEWNRNDTGNPRSSESVLHDFDRVPLAPLPAPLLGMRRVTEEVAQMVVNTLLAPGNWHLATGQNQNRFTTEGTEEHGGRRIKRADEIADAQVSTRMGSEEKICFLCDPLCPLW
jgi:hypothetical protein